MTLTAILTDDVVLQAIYCSRATCEFTDEALLSLLEKARTKNFRLGISGMLVFDRGLFMQVIEGPDEAIESLLATLDHDPQHDHFRILSMRQIHAREFGDWDMAFFLREPYVADGYLSLTSLDADLDYATSVAAQMLTLFRDGMFRDARDHGEESLGGCTVTIRSGAKTANTSQRNYLTNMGNAIASAMPDVAVAVGTNTLTPMKYRNLDFGEIEMF